MPLGNVGIEVWRLDKAEEELVDDLQMGPCKLEDRLVLLGVVSIPARIDRRRYRSK